LLLDSFCQLPDSFYQLNHQINTTLCFLGKQNLKPLLDFKTLL